MPAPPPTGRPSLSEITANFFVNLINRLGVRPPPADAFLLSNIVTPVSIVDADISIPAQLTTFLLDVPFSVGELLAPVANTVLADTGPQVAGNYNVFIITGLDGVVGGTSPIRIQRRDAANAANIWSQLVSLNNSGTDEMLWSGTFRLALNERIRVITQAGTTAGMTVQASIWIVPVS